MSEIKLFNYKDISDFPEECKQQLKPLRVREQTKKLLELFDRKSPLSIDEIIVGFYRLYNINKTRSWVSSSFYNLCKKNLIKKSDIEKCKYEKII